MAELLGLGLIYFGICRHFRGRYCAVCQERAKAKAHGELRPRRLLRFRRAKPGVPPPPPGPPCPNPMCRKEQHPDNRRCWACGADLRRASE
jgi:hypothetical protein